MDLVKIGMSVLTSCMNVKEGENVLVITDDRKFSIGDALYQAAKALGADAMLVTMTPREVSGQEPPASIAAAMKAADVVLCPMSTSITHTRAKIEAAKAGARIATMPNITEDMFCQGAMTANYDTVLELTRRVTELLTQASTARIEKIGAFKDKYEKLDKGIDETYEALDKTQDRLYKAILAPEGSKTPPHEEEKTDFESMAAAFADTIKKGN